MLSQSNWSTIPSFLSYLMEDELIYDLRLLLQCRRECVIWRLTFKENHGNFFLVVGSGFCLFLAFSFGLAGFFVCLRVGVLLLFFFFYLSEINIFSCIFSLWVSCNNPKATGQCKMEMQFKVLGIRMDKRRLSKKKLMTFYYK